jgi:hypothetical protein
MVVLLQPSEASAIRYAAMKSEAVGRCRRA